jgi:hypothetical protein
MRLDAEPTNEERQRIQIEQNERRRVTSTGKTPWALHLAKSILAGNHFAKNLGDIPAIAIDDAMKLSKALVESENRIAELERALEQAPHPFDGREPHASDYQEWWKSSRVVLSDSGEQK